MTTEHCPVLLVDALDAETISVSRVLLDLSGPAEAARVNALLETLLPRIGMPQLLGGVGDATHVLVHSPARAIADLIRFAGEHGVYVRDVTPVIDALERTDRHPVAPEDAPTHPYVRDTVVVDDPDATAHAVPEIVIREDGRTWTAEEVATLAIRPDALNLPHEIRQRLTARGYRAILIDALDYRFVVEVVRA